MGVHICHVLLLHSYANLRFMKNSNNQLVRYIALVLEEGF